MDLNALFPGRTTTSHPPARDDLPLAKFEVVHVAPAADEPHVYVTQGAAEHGHEFLLYTPKADPWFIDVLTSVSYFQSFYGLEVGQTYKFARGWLPGSQLNRLLLHSERVGDFVRLVPITEDEEKLVKSHGAAALEARLRGANLLAQERSSVA